MNTQTLSRSVAVSLVVVFALIALAPGALLSSDQLPGPDRASADDWVPVGCPNPPIEKWARFRDEIENAIPSSTLYVPFPFPKTRVQILADFKAEYLRSWSTTKYGDLPEEERPLWNGLQDGRLRFEIYRVVNWSPTRCQPNRPKHFYYLLRIFNPEGGEFFRYTLVESGQWSSAISIPDPAKYAESGWEPFRSVEKSLRMIEGRFGISGLDAQFVHGGGGTVRCDLTIPCVAFRRDNSSYVFDPSPWGGLYEFSPSSQRVTLDEVHQRSLAAGHNVAPFASIERDTEGVISVGAGWVRARKVPPIEN